MKKLYRNKKGLSTVISTILMIMVVMVGMSILFAYVTVYADNYKAGIGSSVLEHLTIEDIWIQDQHIVQFTVYNTGTQTNLGTNVDLKVATIYVNGTALSTNPSSNSIDFNQPVIAGSHTVIVGYSSFQLGPGNIYDFKIVTSRGSSFEQQYTTP